MNRPGRPKNTEEDIKFKELKSAMRMLIFDEFRDCRRSGVIVITYEEMTNVFINLLAEFIKFKKETDLLIPEGK